MIPHARPFILLDRDGTLNVERDYLSDPDQLELLPGVPAALRRLRDLGFGLVVVTNQSGIGRGYFTSGTVDLIHDRLRCLLAAEGASLDGIYVCPHGPDDGCDCRKPLPGMVRQAAADWGFDPKASIVIGDKDADIDLGRSVGARSILVRTGWGRDTERAGRCRPDAIVDDLPKAVDWILSLRQGDIEIEAG
jgi:D-glycero-D-manno-heptose 1,7-bisphosphate phosphatase